MANFLIVIDGDAERRARFVTAAEPRLAPFPGLVTVRVDCGDFTAAWAAGKRAPIDRSLGQGHVAVVWGEARDDCAGKVTASALAERWAVDAPEGSGALAGFHAAAFYSTDGTLVVGGDVLGLFPIYYWSADSLLLVASSPELFQLHPRFAARLDLGGLSGLLLLGGLAEGRTLWQGVTRLSPGHLLCSRPGCPPRERLQFDPQPDTRHFDLPWSAQCALYTETLTSAVRRHTGSGACGLLLSGGRDSRMLAGFLHAGGSSVVALTLGLPDDIEMQCAGRVARASRFDHRAASVDAGRYPACVDLDVSWEHLAGGLSDPTNWGLQAALDALPARLITGYTMDAVVGGSHIHWALDKGSRRLSFTTLLDKVNEGAVPLRVLKRLLAPPAFRGLLEDTIERLRSRHQRSAEFEFQRAWRFDLEHRQRFHVGRSLWPLSFSTWPAVPTADPDVIRMAAGLPAAALAERHLQDAVLCRTFPRLAALPLDRNSYNTTPLQPPLGALLKSAAISTVARRHWRLQRLLDGAPRRDGRERRYYFRVFDIDGAGWRAVRRSAEPLRERVHGILDGETLDAFLPRPDRPLRLANGITDSGGLKLLLGLMLWSRDHW